MTESWEIAWREGRTGWDAGGSPPILLQLVANGDVPEGRVIVPGCGSGYDVFTLSGSGRVAVGFDLAPTAAARFDAVRKQLGVSPEVASIRTENFFEFAIEDRFDVMWDYTFLCAIDPTMREQWAARAAKILKPGGSLFSLIFPVDPARPDNEGPPFRLSPELVAELLDPLANQSAIVVVVAVKVGIRHNVPRRLRSHRR